MNGTKHKFSRITAILLSVLMTSEAIFMKTGKKFKCILMAVTMLLSSVCITAAADMTLVTVNPYWKPEGEDRSTLEGAYYELQPDTSDTPEMPDVLKNRKPKHHVFERNEDHSLNFRGELIMPGDTFEFQNDITRDMIYTIDFYGRGDAYIHKEYGREEVYFSEYSPENYGIEVTGSVDITGYDDFDSGDGINLDGKHVTDKFIRTGKNNLNCPIILGPTGGGGDGPYLFFSDHDQRRQHTDVCYTVLAPYYHIYYRFLDEPSESSDYERISYEGFEDFLEYRMNDQKTLFWPTGEFEELDFPQYYWLTDEPYTLTFPNPCYPGRGFDRWNGYDSTLLTTLTTTLTYKDNDPKKTIKNNCTELKVQWTYDVATEIHDPFEYIYEDSDGETKMAVYDNVHIEYRLPEVFEDVNICGAGNLTLTPGIGGNHRTILFDPNGGTINGRDKYLIEVNEVKREDEAKYGENGDSRIPDDGDFGFDINDYIPEKEGDTFLGWCAKDNTLYSSFVTKDSTIEAYRYFWEDDEYGTYTDKYCEQHFYAKWASETDEALEKNGWKITDDGTLFIIDDEGAENWVKALKADSTLASKVKDVKLGYKGESVQTLPAKFLDGCTEVTELVFDEPVAFSAYAFDNCPNLTDVSVNFAVTNSWFSFVQYFGTNKDFTLHVPDEYYEDYKNALGDYAYLLEKPNTQRYKLTVNGTVITDDNLEIKCGDGTAVFDPKTNTLTLTNATLTNSLSPHFANHYNVDTPDAPNGAGGTNNYAVVSQLDKLTVVIEGNVTVNTVVDNAYGSSHEELPYFIYAAGDLEIKGGGTLKATKEDMSFYYKDNETMDFIEYVGPGKVSSYIKGDLTLKDVTTERLYANIDGSFNGENAKLFGGTISVNGDINANNLIVKDFNAPEGDMMLAQELAYIYSNGKTVDLKNCDFDYTVINAFDSEKINITDSKISLTQALEGGQSSKLNITNSDINIIGGMDILGENRMPTNISPDNITLKNAEIIAGGWTDNYIMIKPAENQAVSILGDVNGDGKVTAKDSMQVHRFVIHLAQLDENQQKLADVDKNGKVTAADALVILRYTIGLPTNGLIGELIE